MDLGFASGGGECGEILRSINWDKHALGPMALWPQSLKTSLSILLNSKFPMFLMWGPEYFCFYNDAYRPSLGNNGKHPYAIGKKGREVWAEIWEQVGDMLHGVMYRNEATWNEDYLIPIYRNGKIEDVYWTFSYSPVKDETGGVAGIFVAVMETTGKYHLMNHINDINRELEFAIDAAELGTFDYNPLTNKFKANKRLRDWFGLSKTAETDLNVALEAVVEEHRDMVSKKIFKALDPSGNGKYAVNYTIKNKKTGALIYVKAKGECLFNELNEPIKLNGTLQDISEEVLAEKALQQNEQELNTIFSTVQVGMVLLQGPDFKVDRFNQAYLTLVGKTTNDLIGKTLLEAFPESNINGVANNLRQVYQTGEAYSALDYAYKIQVEGQNKTLHTNLFFEPLKDRNGKTDRILISIIDISEVVANTQRIEDAEERLRLASLASGIGSFDLDIKTGKINSTKKFDEIFGFHETRNWSDYSSRIHPDDRGLRMEAHKNAFQTGRLYYEARLVIEETSQTKWMRFEGQIYYDLDGKPARMLGTALDVTREHHDKKKLQELNQHLQIALESGNIGTYEYNLITEDIFCSDLYLKNWGLSTDIKPNIVEIRRMVDPIYFAEIERIIEIAQTGNGFYDLEFPITDPSGNIRWLKDSGKVQYDQLGNPISLIGVSFDITQTKALEQQKDDFIGIASHELKTPVTSIKAYAQVLERILRKKGYEKEAELMLKMDAQLNRLTELIGDLLDVTKINAGKLQYNRGYFNFEDMLRTQIEELQRTTDTHNIALDAKTIGNVYGDKERLEQVLVNLVTNAIKYSPKAKEIIVHSYEENNNAIVCVQDFGIGIAEEKLNKVFEQFYRVSGNMQHTFPGLGLGLYISSEIIKREGGKIWVNSIEGKGSSFCFSIPKHPKM